MLVACKAKRDADHEARPVEPAPVSRDAAVDASVWPQLAELPLVPAVRTVILPSRPDQPRFDVVGPVILGDIAVVGSSQLGFAGIDWRRGSVAWTKPAGSRLAPPAVHDDELLLIGDCLGTPQVPESEQLLGCLRSVTPLGADQAYIAIHGKADVVDEFSHSAGDQHVWVEGHRVRWVRGDHAVTIDVMSGVATRASTIAPPLSVNYQGRHWDIRHEDGWLIADAKPPDAWKSESGGVLLGAVYLPKQSPIVRSARVGGRYREPEVRISDINATGSLMGAVSWDSVPGIAVLAHAISPVGDVALAVRLDKTLKHDFIVGYAANALLLWVYPLPETTRVDPIGIAVGLDAERAPEAVVVFHDGDTVTILPELSSPPTAPGAVRGPSENATP
ncbi:hypothetical protein BH11MYX3_BH11MYX3_32120 [soil metagenome]